MRAVLQSIRADELQGHSKIVPQVIAKSSNILTMSHNILAVGHEKKENKAVKRIIGAVLAGTHANFG